MTRRLFVVSCCVLLAAAVDVRAGARREDRQGGSDFRHVDGDAHAAERPGPLSVTMELKFDGKSAVTGTVAGLPNPAEVKAGTFDPKNGALNLKLGKTSGPEVLLVLDGTVVKGTASGKVNGDGGAGEFKITKKP